MKTWITAVALFVVSVVSAQAIRTKHLVVVMMDGYRWQELYRGADSALLFNKKYNGMDSARYVQKYWAADQKTRREILMPFVWSHIAKEGQLYGNRDLGNKVNVKNTYWFSYPGRSELFCGYFDPAVNSNEYPDNPNENVLEFINKQKGYEGQVVSFASWNAVARILNRDRNGMLINIYGEDVKGSDLTPLQKEANAFQHYSVDLFGPGERPDANTYLLTKAYLRAKHPGVLYIDFGDTDEFGHGGRYDFYLDAANKIDAMIADLWDLLQQDPFYKDNTTLMIIPDHGRGEGAEWTSHGRKTAHSDQTYLMVMGPDTPASGEQKTQGQIYEEQYAQTMAMVLGFHFTAAHPIAEPIKSVLK
jgi:hypothetical protein